MALFFVVNLKNKSYGVGPKPLNFEERKLLITKVINNYGNYYVNSY